LKDPVYIPNTYCKKNYKTSHTWSLALSFFSFDLWRRKFRHRKWIIRVLLSDTFSSVKMQISSTWKKKKKKLVKSRVATRCFSLQFFFALYFVFTEPGVNSSKLFYLLANNIYFLLLSLTLANIKDFSYVTKSQA